MPFYFSWINKNDDFDPLIHNQSSIDIFNLSISQTEGLFATALVAIKNPYVDGVVLNKQWCFISWEEKLLFKGRLASAPKSLDKDLVQLKFIARSDDFRKMLNDASVDLKPQVDDLFHDDIQTLQPADLLLSQQELFYCDPRNHNIKLSNIFKGSKQKVLGQNFFYDSFDMKVVNSPVKTVEVEVVAQWVQEFSNRVDVTASILNKTPYGLISTLNGKTWGDNWWKTGQKLKGSNYSIYFVELNKVTPPRTGVLNIYPRQSQTFKVMGENKVLERAWFCPELILSYTYRQKRKETAKFTLQQNLQEGTESSCKKLTFHLQKLIETNQVWEPETNYYPGARVINGEYVWQCQVGHKSLDNFEQQYWVRLRRGQHVSEQATKNTFFTNTRGAKALNYAYRIAQAHLANSARAVCISLRGKLEDLYDISTDHSLTITDSRIPGKTVTGKVYSYDICVDGPTGTRYVEVKLLLSVGGVADAAGVIEQVFDYCEASYVEVDPSDLYEGFKGWEYSVAPQGLDNPLYYNSEDFVEYVEVSNDGARQNQLLLNKEFESTTDLNKFLNNNTTHVAFKLKNLSTKACYNQELTLRPKSNFSAPQQIKFI